MKFTHYILALSLILNVALFAYVKPFAPRTRTPIVSVRTLTQKPATPNISARSLKYATTEQLMQRLTAMGIPPDIIRAVIINKIFKENGDKIMSKTGYYDPRYWQAPQRQHSLSSLAKGLEIDREGEELFQKLLGMSERQYFASEYRHLSLPEGLRRKYGDMPDEKLLAVSNIDEKYWKQRMASVEKGAKANNHGEDEETQNQWNAMMRQQHDELAKLLTPAELFEYDVRENSQRLKAETEYFNITEQEFRDMFTVWQKTTDRFDATNIPPEFATQQERDDYRDAQYRQILGDERYADYLQSRNPAYEALNNIALNNNRPLSAAREVVSVQTDLTQRAAAIAADPTLTYDDRAARYNALAQEAQTRITQALGKRGYTAYRGNSQNWIQSLEGGKAPGGTGR